VALLLRDGALNWSPGGAWVIVPGDRKDPALEKHVIHAEFTADTAALFRDAMMVVLGRAANHDQRAEVEVAVTVEVRAIYRSINFTLSAYFPRSAMIRAP
jgi:hypothetical protein